MMGIVIPRNPGAPNPNHRNGDTGRGSIFERLTAKIRWEREHVEPALGKDLFPYYTHYCYIFIEPYRYTGPGYGNYRSDRDETYDEVGKRLAAMWPGNEETEDRKFNHYRR